MLVIYNRNKESILDIKTKPHTNVSSDHFNFVHAVFIVEKAFVLVFSRYHDAI